MMYVDDVKKCRYLPYVSCSMCVKEYLGNLTQLFQADWTLNFAAAAVDAAAVDAATVDAATVDAAVHKWHLY